MRPSGVLESVKWEVLAVEGHLIPDCCLRELGKFNLKQGLGAISLCTKGNHFMQFGVTVHHVLFIFYTGREIEYYALFWHRKPALFSRTGHSINTAACSLFDYVLQSGFCAFYIKSDMHSEFICHTHYIFLYYVLQSIILSERGDGVGLR